VEPVPANSEPGYLSFGGNSLYIIFQRIIWDQFLLDNYEVFLVLVSGTN
jgi:hypothetical protein